MEDIEIIIFGYPKFNKEFGVKRRSNCKTCTTQEFTYIRQITFFTLFFIPLIPIMFSYYRICNNCKTSSTISKKTFFDELNMIDEEVVVEEESIEKNIKTINFTRTAQNRYKKHAVEIFADNKSLAHIADNENISLEIDANKHRNIFVQICTFNRVSNSEVVYLQNLNDEDTLVISLKVKYSTGDIIPTLTQKN